MNIFKALSQGNGRISETNITSFLSYLLDNQSEIGPSFLLLFLELIDNSVSDSANRTKKLLHIDKSGFRENLLLFKSKYSFSSEAEYRIHKDGEVLIVDVLLTITDQSRQNDLVYFLIENKIKRESNKDDDQLKDQFLLFKDSDDHQDDVPIYSVLLTIDDDSFSEMLTSVLTINPNSCWLRWTNYKPNEDSVVSCLKKLLLLDQNADIQPINPNTQFILKSFIDYILTEYSHQERGEWNYSINGSEVLSTAIVKIDEGDVTKIKRYDNGMIRLFDSRDNLLDVAVKPILRKNQ